MFKRFLLIISLISIPSYAQELTSDITGTVLNSAGNNVSNARVVLTYEPTNSESVRVTGANGRFSFGGLKPGGPYTVSVSSADFNSEEVSNVNLVVGDTTRLNFILESIDEVVVVAERTERLDTGYGFGTALTAEDIEKNVSVQRDLKDFVRLNPLVSLDDAEENYEAISIAGAHPRSNDLRVDGVSFNDDFGLNANGYPAQRSPISLNAIEQLAVKVAPASVEYSGFRGGVIEIITKSGTNDFTGEVFFYDRGDSLMGNESEGQKYQFELDDTSEGFAFGGPIIKDKAFFYITYEEAEISKPITHGPIGSGLPNEIRITTAEVDNIRSITQSVYGFDPLGYTSSNVSSQEYWTYRFDVDIDDIHRLTLNYKEVDSTQLRNQNTSSSTMKFSSQEYNKGEITETSGLLLVSNWTDDFVTEFSYTTKDQITSQQSPLGQNLPSFQINNCGSQGIRCLLGPDIFRSANDLKTTTDYLKLKGTYYRDNHKLTFGYENKVWDIYNVFLEAQDGEYEFDGLAAYQAQTASSFSHNNSRDLTQEGAAAIFEYYLDSIYIQDEIDLSDKLNVLVGLRYDRFDSDDAPAVNQGFVDTFGFANGGIEGTDILNYRFSFEYEIDDVSSVKGLFGTFSSKLPTVWISNAYTNDGVRTAAYSQANAPAGCSPTTNVTTTLPACVGQAIQNAPLTQSKIDFIAPSFEWPETKTFNITYEREMGDWYLQATYLNSKQEEANYKILDTGTPLVGDMPTKPTLTAPDGRPIYNQSESQFKTTKFGLYNVGGAQREVVSFSLSKLFNDGDSSLTFGYTHQNIDMICSMQSSTSHSNYGKCPASDFNNRVPSRSIYETEHRFFATLSSTHYFFGADKPTTFNLFFERKSGLPGTLTFDTYSSPGRYKTQAFGYERRVNDDNAHLLYIPDGLDDPLVCWVSCSNPNNAVGSEILNLLYDTYGLERFRGRILPPGVFEFPWQTSLDLKITQILPGFRDDDGFVISLGIENLLNLIDDEEGVIRYGAFDGKIDVFDFQLTDDYSKYIFGNSRGADYAFRYNPSNPYELRKSAVNSIWRAQLGVTYKFSLSF